MGCLFGSWAFFRKLHREKIIVWPESIKFKGMTFEVLDDYFWILRSINGTLKIGINLE
jgi:hypothetical protein